MARLRSGSIIFTAVVLTLAAMPAAGYLVTNLSDAGAGSLRQAVIDANTNAGADVITFQPGLTGTIGLTSGEIAITDSVDIQGPGARVLAVTSTARIFNMSGGDTVSVTISGLTLSGARATGDGGAIFNSGANVTLRSDTLSGNSATGEGGAIFNNYINNPNGGTFTIDSSTLSGNHANKAGAIKSIGFHMVIINSTISGNNADDSVGGIKLEFAFASIYNSTISGNTAVFGGGISLNLAFQLDLVSTIVANNTDGTGASDLARTGSSTINASDSLIEQSLAVGVINGTNTGNLVGVDPMLGPLADYGGPTDTQALLWGSPAINAGSNPQSLATDQRGPGFPREALGRTDIGAYEFQSSDSIPVLSPAGVLALGLLLLTLGALTLRRRCRATS